MITGSIVTFHNNFEDLEAAISSFLNTNFKIKLYISDNSYNREIEKLCTDNRIEYIYNNANLGFGTAHNRAIKRAIEEGSTYHLVLNPDISFNKGTIEKLSKYLDENDDVGLVMPKVYYFNGEIQKLCKLLPTPLNLIGRRFIPIKSLIKKMDYKYEMQFFDYSSEAEVPFLSGCFMFIRTNIFDDVGLFDEKIFMYLEDTDLSRRINKKYKTTYYPEVEIFHKFEKGSYKNRKLLWYNIKSAIYYFNKWGWFFDNDRRKINREVLKKYDLK